MGESRTEKIREYAAKGMANTAICEIADNLEHLQRQIEALKPQNIVRADAQREAVLVTAERDAAIAERDAARERLAKVEEAAKALLDTTVRASDGNWTPLWNADNALRTLLQEKHDG